MRKLFEAQAYGFPLKQEWNCLEAHTANVKFPSSAYLLAWGCSGTEIGGTTNLIGSGDANTDAIVAGCVTAYIPAKAARQSIGGFDDWYLPNGVELQAMYAQRDIITGFGGSLVPYWSSLEDTDIAAFYMTDGSVTSSVKTNTAYTRPIRKVSGVYEIGDTGPGGGIIFYKKPATPTHKISVYDVDLVEDDSAVDIIMESPTYSVTWNAGIVDVVTGGIVESSADFTIRNIDSVLSGFMEDLAANPEGRFIVDIQKKTVLTETWESFWKGIIMPDFSGRGDIPDEPISFQATDGMAMLDSIECVGQDSEVMLVTVIKGLRQIPTVGLFDTLSELRFLWAETEWFSEDTPVDEEPLYQVGLFGQSLWVKKEQKEGYSGVIKTEIISMTYKEVIQHICERFNCVLVMQQGAWYLYQRDLLKETNVTFETYRAYPTGIPDNWQTNPDSTTVASLKAIDQSNRYRAGGEFFSLPALKSVEVIYGGGNLADGNDSLLPSGWIPDQEYTTMDLEIGAGNYLHIRGSFTEHFVIDYLTANPPDLYFKARAKYKLLVTCGSYYLNPSNGDWDLSPLVSNYYIYSSYMYHNQNAVDNYWRFIDKVLVDIDIITDELPDDGPIVFELQRHEISIAANESGAFTCVIGDDFGFTPDLDNHFMFYIVDDENPVTYASFIAENPTSGFMLEHDMGESLFGTARVIMNRVLGVHNGGGELWGVGFSGTKTMYFNELLVHQIMKRQAKGLLCFSGTIHERDEEYMQLINALTFEINSIEYTLVFNNVTYQAQTESWNGDWFEIYREIGTITPVSDEELVNIDSHPIQPSPALPPFEEAFQEIYDIDTGDVDVTQQGTEGGIITNHTTFDAQAVIDSPAEGKVLVQSDENSILKTTDYFGNVKIIGESASKVIPNPDVIIYDGFLYNWLVTQEATLISALGIKEGWAVPTSAEFTTLIDYLIARGFNYDDTVVDNKIGKAVCTDSGWDVSATVGAVGNTDYPAKQNVTGFSAKPTGYRTNTGAYLNMGMSAWFWSKTEVNSTSSFSFICSYYDIRFGATSTLKLMGNAIRLFRPATAPELFHADGTAINSTYYGNDGKPYNGVKLGTQIWLSQNLAETKWSTGVEIPLCEPAATWIALTVPARCSYDNDVDNSISDPNEFILANNASMPANIVSYDNTDSGLTAAEAQAAIDEIVTLFASYVPYTGATADLDLGAYLLKAAGLISPKWYPATNSVTALQITKADGTTVIVNIDTTNGRVGFGGIVAPTAKVHLPAGTAVAGTAPIKLTDGAFLTTPETGTIEFYNSKFTITNKSVRKVIDRTSDVKLTTSTVSNTDTETTVFTGLLPANSLVAGNILKLVMFGTIDEAAASDEVTIRIKIGTTTMATIESPASGVTAKCWHIKGSGILRTAGASGEMAWHIDMDAAGNSEDACGVDTVDTTTAENITVTAEWNNAKAGNIFTCTGGFMEYKN